jgi:hypothetical protein
VEDALKSLAHMAKPSEYKEVLLALLNSQNGHQAVLPN